MTEARLSLGTWGENFAASYLRKQGLKILQRNLRTPVGEIDIVARDRKALVFVEVKTRQSRQYGTPQEAVGAHKQRHPDRPVVSERAPGSETAAAFRCRGAAQDR